MNEEQLRIRGYLQSQAAKLSPAELVTKVRTDQEQLRAAAESVAPDRFTERPGTSEWSANEVFAHVVTSGGDVARAIATVLDGGSPPTRVEDVMRHSPEQRTAGQWWQALVQDRDTLFGRVAQAAPDARLDVTWEHPVFGPLNWREWLLFLRIHDLDHARQMQAIAGAETGAAG